MAYELGMRDWSADVCSSDLDGAMSAGMAYESMNNAGSTNSRRIVILNDNDMSIAPAVGAMSAYLSQIVSSRSYRSFRHIAKQVAQRLPKPLERTAKRAEEFARGLVTGGTLFEELGFLYVGPVDGHNLRSEEHTSELQSLMRTSYAV